MARVKCYWCEARFPEESTRLHRAMVGGSYNRRSSPRDVRACYRCIASRGWSAALNYGTPQGLTADEYDALRITELRKRGWNPDAMPTLEEAGAEYHRHHRFFGALWPQDAQRPAFPDAFPKRLLPPEVGEDSDSSA